MPKRSPWTTWQWRRRQTRSLQISDLSERPHAATLSTEGGQLGLLHGVGLGALAFET